MRVRPRAVGVGVGACGDVFGVSARSYGDSEGDHEQRRHDRARLLPTGRAGPEPHRRPGLLRLPGLGRQQRCRGGQWRSTRGNRAPDSRRSSRSCRGSTHEAGLGRPVRRDRRPEAQRRGHSDAVSQLSDGVGGRERRLGAEGTSFGVLEDGFGLGHDRCRMVQGGGEHRACGNPTGTERKGSGDTMGDDAGVVVFAPHLLGAEPEDVAGVLR